MAHHRWRNTEGEKSRIIIRVLQLSPQVRHGRRPRFALPLPHLLPPPLALPHLLDPVTAREIAAPSPSPSTTTGLPLLTDRFGTTPLAEFTPPPGADNVLDDPVGARRMVQLVPFGLPTDVHAKTTLAVVADVRGSFRRHQEQGGGKDCC
jgi:hypothetical protein